MRWPVEARSPASAARLPLGAGPSGGFRPWPPQRLGDRLDRISVVVSLTPRPPPVPSDLQTMRPEFSPASIPMATALRLSSVTTSHIAGRLGLHFTVRPYLRSAILRMAVAVMSTLRPTPYERQVPLSIYFCQIRAGPQLIWLRHQPTWRCLTEHQRLSSRRISRAPKPCHFSLHVQSAIFRRSSAVCKFKT